MNFSKLDGRFWLLTAAAVAVLGSAAFSRWGRRPRDPDEAERRRRARVNQIGRIAEGRVLEVMDADPAPEQARGFSKFARAKSTPAVAADRRKLLCYSYSISGVSYETAQDITGLTQRAGLDRLVAGQPASVKYDPVNPSNSIVVAEDWSGVS